MLLEPQEEYQGDLDYFTSLQSLYLQFIDKLVEVQQLSVPFGSQPAQLSHEAATTLVVKLLSLGLVSSVNLLERSSQIVLKQALWKEAGVFMKVMNLLNDDAPSPSARGDLQRLLAAAIDALVSLLQENEETKAYFEDHIGYEQLQQLIVNVFSGCPSFAALKAPLFGLVVDGRYDPSARCLVLNPQALSLLVHLLPHLSAPDQVQLFTELEALLQTSATNKAIAVQCGMTSELIEYLPTASRASLTPYSLDAIRGGITEGPAEAKLLPWTLRIIEVLARHSIGVLELKKLLRTITHENFGQEGAASKRPVPALTPSILSVIEAVASQRILVGPSAAFDFDGKSSFIALPVRSLSTPLPPLIPPGLPEVPPPRRGRSGSLHSLPVAARGVL